MSQQKKSYKIASIPGDGIGPEVIDAGIQVLRKLTKELGTFNLDFQDLNWGSEYYKREGKYMPENALETVRGCDAVFFGCVGDVGMFSSCHFPYHVILFSTSHYTPIRL